MPPPKAGEKPRTVQLRSFWLGQTELTWDELQVWAFRLDLTTEKERIDAIGGTHPSLGMAHYAWGSNPTACQSGYPAVALTSHAVKAYCQWLSKLTGRRFRLPTEAEWEYAARAGNLADAPNPKTLDKIAWYAENSKNDPDDLTTHKVATKAPSPFGLHDMLGNVAEWVVPDDVPFVIKGGSFRSHASQLQCAWRQQYQAKWQLRDPEIPKNKWLFTDAPFVGFRVAMDD